MSTVKPYMLAAITFHGVEVSVFLWFSPPEVAAGTHLVITAGTAHVWG